MHRGGGQTFFVGCSGAYDAVNEEMVVSEANYLVSEANIIVNEASKISAFNKCHCTDSIKNDEGIANCNSCLYDGH